MTLTPPASSAIEGELDPEALHEAQQFRGQGGSIEGTIRTYLRAARPAGGRTEPVAWMHPNAKWASVSYDDIARHCRLKLGENPIPLYASPGQDVRVKGLEDALRDFPDFEGGADITPEAIRALAKAHMTMIMEGPSQVVEFFDQDGKVRELEWENFDDISGYTIKDAAWEVAPPGALEQPPADVRAAAFNRAEAIAWSNETPIPDKLPTDTREAFTQGAAAAGQQIAEAIHRLSPAGQP